MQPSLPPPSSPPPEHLPPPFPLEEVKVPIVENSVCDSKYHTGVYTGDNTKIVQDSMMCAGNEERDACQVGPYPAQVPTASASPALLTPLLPRETQEGPWSARSTAPGCRRVWSAGATAVPSTTGPASTPVSPATWTGSTSMSPRSPEPVPGAAPCGCGESSPFLPPDHCLLPRC